jgi:Domain of unknown function (DUF3597)
MSLLMSILDSIGLNNAASVEPTPLTPKLQAVVSETTATTPTTTITNTVSTPSSVAPVAAATANSTVDVMARLEAIAEERNMNLNWRTSIVDLLKLLNLESSLAARQSLAEELDCPEQIMADSAQMNVWLHKAVLKKFAEHGGDVSLDLF